MIVTYPRSTRDPMTTDTAVVILAKRESLRTTGADAIDPVRSEGS